MLRKHLVIVGGGFAGLTLARSLKRVSSKSLRVTIVSDSASFRYCPALYRIATGHQEREGIIPIHQIIDDLPNAEFIHDTALRIDRSARTITLAGGKELHYDYAVLALGATTSYFDIPGLRENSYDIKTPHGLHRLRHHLHQTLIDDQEPDKNYLVVGAGPTGIELSAALLSYMQRVVKRHRLRRRKINISLIEAANRPAPALSETASRIISRRLRSLGIHLRLNSVVEAETAESLNVGGTSIPSHTVIWVAGVTTNPFFRKNESQFTLNARGKVVVDEFLRVDTHTFVIGDNAATTYSGLAQTAVHNARYVAKHIKAHQGGSRYTQPYKPQTPLTIIPGGRNWAIACYKRLCISGRLAAALRSIADLVGYSDVMGVRKALRIWVRSNEQDERCFLCQTSMAHTQTQSSLS